MRSRRLLPIIFVAGLLATPAGASATTINVETPMDQYAQDQGLCGLREAITAANVDNAGPPPSGCPIGGGADVIMVPTNTYKLTRVGEDDTAFAGDLDINDPDPGETITVRGVGPGSVVIDQDAPGRVFDLLVDGTTLDGLTITGGQDERGAGVQVTGASNLISNSTITQNDATTSLTSDGGAVSTFPAGSGLVIESSTLSNNSANQAGGAIFDNDGQIEIRNTTVMGNHADRDGNDNGSGGGTESLAGSVVSRNSIIAGNGAAASSGTPDCAGGLDSLGNTLLGSVAGCSFLTAPRDIVGQDPLLGPLADNGGHGMTHALLAGSPALDRGAGCGVQDQRGLARSLGGLCDIGPYERVLCKGIAVNRFGTEGDDAIGGTSRADSILALGGDDEAFGFEGDDVLCGGAGADRLLGKDGNDLIVGGKGGDRLLGDTGKDRLLGQGGRDKLKGAPGKDVLNGGPGADNLNGGPGKDKLKGGKGKDKQTQ